MSPASLRDRTAFLLAVQRVAPEVFAELRAIPPAPAIPTTPVQLRQYPRRLAARMAAVREWAQRHHLDGPGLEWVAEQFIRDDSLGAAGEPLEHGRALALSWEPAEDGCDRVAFLEHALAAAERYADEVETWAKQHGIPTHRERKRAVRPGLKRWDILARKVVLRETYADIAERLGPARVGGIDRAAARRHAEVLAKRLGIPLSRLGT